MKTTTVVPRPFVRSLKKATEWLQEIQAVLHDNEGDKSYRVLRAGLHALRDRLPAAEAADLAAQLPMLLRGMFYEGYSPLRANHAVHSREDFLQTVAARLQLPHDPDPETTIRIVFRLLREHVTAGEIKDIKSVLPKDLEDLWD